MVRICNKGCHFQHGPTYRHYIPAQSFDLRWGLFLIHPFHLLFFPPTSPLPEITWRNSLSLKHPLLSTNQTWVTRVYGCPRLLLELSVRVSGTRPPVRSLWDCLFFGLSPYLKLSWKPAFLEALRGMRFPAQQPSSIFVELASLWWLPSRHGDAGTGASEGSKSVEL